MVQTQGFLDPPLQCSTTIIYVYYWLKLPLACQPCEVYHTIGRIVSFVARQVILMHANLLTGQPASKLDGGFRVEVCVGRSCYKSRKRGAIWRQLELFSGHVARTSLFF